MHVIPGSFLQVFLALGHNTIDRLSWGCRFFQRERRSGWKRRKANERCGRKRNRVVDGVSPVGEGCLWIFNKVSRCLVDEDRARQPWLCCVFDIRPSVRPRCPKRTSSHPGEAGREADLSGQQHAPLEAAPGGGGLCSGWRHYGMKWFLIVLLISPPPLNGLVSQRTPG